jgi:hypothetical protein
MEVEMVILKLVKNKADIRESLVNFNTQAGVNKGLAQMLTCQTTFWVYDQSLDKFGPNKFVGYKNMNFSAYACALHGEYHVNYSGVRHHGSVAKHAIEPILGPYKSNTVLTSKLIAWANSFFGAGATAGIDDEKWKFIYL